MEFLDIKLEVKGIEDLPSDGLCTFVSNHPLGGQDGIDKGVEVLNLHGGNPIHINLNVRKKLDKVLMGGKFAEQTVVDPTAFQKCNHFIVQMQLRQWRVDLLPVLCPAQQIIDGNPIEVCQRDKLPCGHGLHLHPDFSRRGGAGKQPVVRNGYPKAVGEG